MHINAEFIYIIIYKEERERSICFFLYLMNYLLSYITSFVISPLQSCLLTHDLQSKGEEEKRKSVSVGSKKR